MEMKKIAIHAVLVAVAAGLLMELMVIRSTAQDMRSNEQVVRISASTFEFKPSEITVKKGVPVTLEFMSQDRHHGFRLSEFHLQADIKPGVVERVRFIPDRIGKFAFFCDVFCGDGHEDMSGILTVIE
jgi:cytochrome c oxidase subunit II